MFAASPMNPLAYNSQDPVVVVTDIRESSSDLDTYTFSACQMDLGTTLQSSGTTSAVTAGNQSPSRAFVVVAVHGEDAAATFAVNSVTIGGVIGAENTDRGGAGAGILVNSAVYTFQTSALQNIANTDVVVTFGEVVTSCAIAVICVRNVMELNVVLSVGATTTGSGTLTLASTIVSADVYRRGIVFCFTTINAPGEIVSFADSIEAASGNGVVMRAKLLYAAENAEFGYAGFYAVHTQTYIASTGFSMAAPNFELSWSGSANADAIRTPPIAF